MKVCQKLISFTLHAVLVIIFSPSASSSSLPPMQIGSSNPTSKDQSHKMSRQLSSEITVHGFLLWSSMGLLTPVGILVIRMANRVECSRRLKLVFYCHAVLQMLSVLFSTIGAVLSIKNFNNSFNNHHQRIGLALYGIIWLQGLTGFLRPQRGSKGRSLWFLMHWILGTTTSLLGVINVYTGLIAYHQKTSKSIRLWTILFTSEISLLALIFLFQEKWVYIQRQHAIEFTRPTTEVISQEKNQKMLTIQSC